MKKNKTKHVIIEPATYSMDKGIEASALKKHIPANECVLSRGRKPHLNFVSSGRFLFYHRENKRPLKKKKKISRKRQ